jgi:hypothetical protein
MEVVFIAGSIGKSNVGDTGQTALPKATGRRYHLGACVRKYWLLRINLLDERRTGKEEVIGPCQQMFNGLEKGFVLRWGTFKGHSNIRKRAALHVYFWANFI